MLATREVLTAERSREREAQLVVRPRVNPKPDSVMIVLCPQCDAKQPKRVRRMVH